MHCIEGLSFLILSCLPGHTKSLAWVQQLKITALGEKLLLPKYLDEKDGGN